MIFADGFLFLSDSGTFQGCQYIYQQGHQRQDEPQGHHHIPLFVFQPNINVHSDTDQRASGKIIHEKRDDAACQAQAVKQSKVRLLKKSRF